MPRVANYIPKAKAGDIRSEDLQRLISDVIIPLEHALRDITTALNSNDRVQTATSSTVPTAITALRGQLVFVPKGSGGNPDEIHAYHLDGAGAATSTQVV